MNVVTVSWPVVVSAVRVTEPLYPVEDGVDDTGRVPEQLLREGDYVFKNGDEDSVKITAESRDRLGADLMLDAQIKDEWCLEMINLIKDPTKEARKEIKSKAQSFIVQGGRLFKVSRFEPRLYVPKKMREAVTACCHDSRLAGHGGHYATLC